jgi:ABC-type glycerol-3-phosphate transport system permease component
MKKKRRAVDFIRITFLFALLVVVILPVLWTVMNAFKSSSEIMNNPGALPTSIDLTNIVGAWQLARFDLYIWNSMLLAGGVVLLGVVVSCPTAYAFAHQKFKGSNLLFYCLFIGLSIPSQAIVISVFYRLKALGIIDRLWGLILVMTGIGIPFNVFVMRSTYRDIPSELRESAMIDGAGEWRTYLTIYFPLSKAGVLAIVVFGFIGAWNEYMYPLVLLISPEKQVIATAITAFKSMTSTNFGYIFGAALISLIPSTLVYILFQRSFIRGVASGAVKG